MKKALIFFSLAILIIFLMAGFLFLNYSYKKIEQKQLETKKIIQEKPQGIMLLIEYKDTIGLANMVDQMTKRNIPGLLMVTPEFVKANCEDIKEIIKHNVEIVASNVDAPFWGMSYEDQKKRIIEMLDGIKSCTGVKPRIISSRYMASDMTTIKVAEELGIPYVTARGTTDTKATVYQPEGYKVKILSVSLIPHVKYKYGSLCDYSYFERNGTPNDMMAELERALEPLTESEKARLGQYHKITPTTHTNIGGYLKPWNDMWLKFWDENPIEWVSLDELMQEVDWKLPLWQIPININNPYTEEKIKPVVPYEEEEKVKNPCAVENIGKEVKSNNTSQAITQEKVTMFHNGQGPMCLDALAFFDSLNYPIEQYLNTDSDFSAKLNQFKSGFSKSEGLSDSFGYYPIIFVKDRAFSGFNETIKKQITELISK